MVFSSSIFLFGFLPLCLFFYYISPERFRNHILLIASLVFYAWGEVFYLAVMLLSIYCNYRVGLLIESAIVKSESSRRSTQFLWLGIALNLLLLVSWKYANFLTDNVNVALQLLSIREIDLKPVHLPLGISFFTFQAISYLVDVYRREVPAQKDLHKLALYIAMFPQLVAGPIVRYHDVSEQINKRLYTNASFASGVERFVFGLAKKMLIANPLGEVADNAFALSGNDLTLPIAWIGIFAYALQIYFDFSGYSDMAIGLGRMFGFKFLENFNYPYVSRSLREFWKRWHISLSTWFRDYVYIPLGGSRVSRYKVIRNLFIVFLLTGVWHGASWNFIVWGLIHGVFLAAEHQGYLRVIERLPKFLQHGYLLLVVMFAWVFFRAEDLTAAITYSAAMLDVSNVVTSQLQFARVLTGEFYYAAIAGIVLSTPLYQKFQGVSLNPQPVVQSIVFSVSRLLLISVLLWLSILKIASSTFNPFIYFRF